MLKDGWKYIILAFLDVEGNYFTVLAYRYTQVLSLAYDPTATNNPTEPSSPPS